MTDNEKLELAKKTLVSVRLRHDNLLVDILRIKNEIAMIQNEIDRLQELIDKKTEE